MRGFHFSKERGRIDRKMPQTQIETLTTLPTFALWRRTMSTEPEPPADAIDVLELLTANECPACQAEKFAGYIFCNHCYQQLDFLTRKILPERVHRFLYIYDRKYVCSDLTRTEFQIAISNAIKQLRSQ